MFGRAIFNEYWERCIQKGIIIKHIINNKIQIVRFIILLLSFIYKTIIYRLIPDFNKRKDNHDY